MVKPTTAHLARLKRAASEPMTVRDAGRPHCYYVESKRGTYLVDTGKNTCTCGDFRHRILKLRRQGNKSAQCKHQIRVNSKPNALTAMALYATAEPKEATE